MFQSNNLWCHTILLFIFLQIIIFLKERGSAGAGLAKDWRSSQERAGKNRPVTGVRGRDLETGEDRPGNIQNIDDKIYRGFLNKDKFVSNKNIYMDLCIYV